MTAAIAAAAAAAALQWSYDETGKTYSTILNDLMQDTAVATLRDTVSQGLSCTLTEAHKHPADFDR
jgi:hypothetical protein